ncbi:DUF732 domain-containing protein [Nocardia sp.]|uniref:DUF732 domain-containing protein n=1 Tax=Nocardia sp. TaxID=1821 RepID=UPI00338E3A45
MLSRHLRSQVNRQAIQCAFLTLAVGILAVACGSSSTESDTSTDQALPAHLSPTATTLPKTISSVPREPAYPAKFAKEFSSTQWATISSIKYGTYVCNSFDAGYLPTAIIDAVYRSLHAQEQPPSRFREWTRADAEYIVYASGDNFCPEYSDAHE